MLDDLKKMAMEQAGKFMTSPSTMKLFSNPNVQKIMTKVFVLKSELNNEIDKRVKAVLKSLNVVTSDDLKKIKKSIQKLESNVQRLKSQVSDLKSKKED